MGERYSGRDLFVLWEYPGGTVPVVGIRSLETSESIDTADATAGDDESHQYIPTLRNLTASLEFLDDAAWDAFSPGTEGVLSWAPEGTAAGRPWNRASALIVSRDRSIDFSDLTTISVEFHLQEAIETWSEKMVTLNTLIGPAAYGGEWTAPVTTETFSTFALNDADNAYTFVFCVPRSGTITKIGCYVDQITGSPPAYAAALVDLGADGKPSTTNHGGSAPGSLAPSSTGWSWVDLVTPATVTAGSMIAAVIKPGSTSPDASNYIAVGSSEILGNGVDNVGMMRYTTAWLSLGGLGPLAVMYNDGIVHGLAVSSYATNSQISINSTPNELGDVFTLPAAVTCYGARVAISSTATNTPFQVRLYNSAGAVLASATVEDSDLINDYGLIDLFWTPVSLPAGTCRLVVAPTSTALIRVGGLQFVDQAARAALPDGSTWMRTERANGGTWTDTATGLMYMGLWISSITLKG